MTGKRVVIRHIISFFALTSNVELWTITAADDVAARTNRQLDAQFGCSSGDRIHGQGMPPLLLVIPRSMHTFSRRKYKQEQRSLHRHHENCRVVCGIIQLRSLVSSRFWRFQCTNFYDLFIESPDELSTFARSRQKSNHRWVFGIKTRRSTELFTACKSPTVPDFPMFMMFIMVLWTRWFFEMVKVALDNVHDACKYLPQHIDTSRRIASRI